jgi:hypothetical protein
VPRHCSDDPVVWVATTQGVIRNSLRSGPLVLWLKSIRVQAVAAMSACRHERHIRNRNIAVRARGRADTQSMRSSSSTSGDRRKL